MDLFLAAGDSTCVNPRWPPSAMQAAMQEGSCFYFFRALSLRQSRVPGGERKLRSGPGVVRRRGEAVEVCTLQRGRGAGWGLCTRGVRAAQPFSCPEWRGGKHCVRFGTSWLRCESVVYGGRSGGGRPCLCAASYSLFLVGVALHLGPTLSLSGRATSDFPSLLPALQRGEGGVVWSELGAALMLSRRCNYCALLTHRPLQFISTFSVKNPDNLVHFLLSSMFFALHLFHRCHHNELKAG